MSYFDYDEQGNVIGPVFPGTFPEAEHERDCPKGAQCRCDEITTEQREDEEASLADAAYERSRA